MFFVLRSCAIAALILAACSLSSTDRARLDADIHTHKCEALSECSEAAARAEGMLVMPDITKAALVLGGAYGEGGARDPWQADGLLQPGWHIAWLAARLSGAGAVIMFMTPSALANFKAHSGWDARRNFGLTTGQSVDDMEVVTALEVGLIDGAPAYTSSSRTAPDGRCFLERSQAHAHDGRALRDGVRETRAHLIGPGARQRRHASLIRLARASALVLAVGGSFGCQALPQLPDSASEQSVPSRLHAGGDVACAGALDWLRAEPTREVRLQLPAASASAGESVINFDVETRHSTASPVASGRLAGIERFPLPHQRRALSRLRDGTAPSS